MKPDVNDFFKGPDRIEYRDQDVTLPVFSYDSMAMTAIHTASTFVHSRVDNSGTGTSRQ